MIINPIVSSENGRSDIFSLNLENRIVLLSGPIEDDMAASVISQLLYLDSVGTAEISLYINSPGGAVSAGMAIYDVMKTLKSPVSTICMGHAASMAAVILSGGSRGRRFILPHGEVMIHQPSGGIDGQATDIRIAAAHIDSVKKDLNDILSENCNVSVREMEEATERDHWMKADEAVRFGIVDGVITKEKEE
ncbi:MAG: ATP-dependent Clp protease proteolytic subunit [Lachnospiraceae bacterium]|nr:ATP-dependent Clp protease proteolytic subunit [Lachnospiraceae bacterium]